MAVDKKKKCGSLKCGRPQNYGEETKQYGRRVPISQHKNVAKLVEDYLKPFLIKG